eukprot:9445608-Heterocapsa_arctica.AAC.1
MGVVAPVPMTGLVATPHTSGKARTPVTFRPVSPVAGPSARKSRRIDPVAGAGYGTGSAAS